ncbi:uncharacterized protein LOC105441325 [Strongylocentrotus purpuratus]|uniref:Death domain-containing protein n=1 Tax=Strongylocentrotus purpuratus TaxID=7668 RepID=A0A7M7P5G1_STRPU|nr:uncharacterized protein LOC105441325 [Strongylocentrotus purpuratus]
MEIGTKLGFSRNKLENFKHKTMQNRKDANIQMLCTWKASQKSGAKATETLKCIFESVSLASAENTGNYGDGTSEDFDLCGGSPSTGEQCSVALPVKSLSLAWELGKALRLDDDVIVGFVAPSDSAAMNRLAWQLLNKWCKCLGSQEKKVLMTKLLQDYNIQDCNAGRDEISSKICTTPDLLDLSRRLDLAGSDILQAMITSVFIPPTSIRRIVLQMLQEWVRHGGTRKRLLEITKAFHSNDAQWNITQVSWTPSLMASLITTVES